MYMSRLSLDSRTAARMGVYEEHQAFWDVFSDGPERKRDFLYRGQGNGRYLAVSSRPPFDAQGVWHIQTKSFYPKLRSGEILAFSVRLNAVRKTRDVQRRQQRHDIVQDLRTRLMGQGQDGTDLPSRTILAEQASLEWFAARRDRFGFSVEPGSLIIEAYQRQSFWKTKGSPPVRFSILDLVGRIKIHDPELTRQSVLHGIGNAKGLGCGLLLVKRI